MGKPRKAKWYVKNGPKILGPLTSRGMRRLAEIGIVTADSLVGREGGNRWIPATKMKRLFRKADAVSDGESELGLAAHESAEPAAAARAGVATPRRMVRPALGPLPRDGLQDVFVRRCLGRREAKQGRNADRWRSRMEVT